MPGHSTKLKPNESLSRVFHDKESYGTTLIVTAIDHYGYDLLQWAPETIRYELRADIGDVPTAAFNKLMAAIMLVNTSSQDLFYQDCPTFISICNALTSGTFDLSVFDMADAEECAWGITEAMILAPPEGDEPFSIDIRAYLGHVLDWEGILEPPDVLRLAVRDTATGLPDYSQFQDDPALFNTAFDNQHAKSEEITNMLRENLQELMTQLNNLDLKNGNTKDLMNKMQGGLR
jgi:hypothetical protein